MSRRRGAGRGGGPRAPPDLRAMGPGRRRRRWLLARRGVAKGDVVCLILPSSIDYAVLYGPAASRRHHLGHQPADGCTGGGVHPRAGRPGPARGRSRGAARPPASALATSSAGRRSPWRCVGRPARSWPEADGARPGGRGVDQRHHRPAQKARSSTTPTWPRWPGAPTSSASPATAACRRSRSPTSPT